MYLMLLMLALIFRSQTSSGICDCANSVNAKQFVKIKAPGVVDPNEKVIILQCAYHMGNDKLFSVNWFKDGNEFFRYVFSTDESSSKMPNIDAFNVQDVLVNMTASNATHIIIQQYHEGRRINVTGSYGCQVSGEGPEFHVMYDEVNITVDVLPTCSDTVIMNIESLYGIGDTLIALCESGPAYPPAQLTFFINGFKVENSSKFRLVSNEINLSKLERHSIYSIATLRLSVKLEVNDFNDAENLSLVCQSCIKKIDNVNFREAKAVISLLPLALSETINKNTSQLKQLNIVAATITEPLSSSAASSVFLSIVTTVFVQIPISATLIFTYFYQLYYLS